METIMKNKILIIVSSIALAFSMHVNAQNQAISGATEKTIIQGLGKIIPNLPAINEVTHTPIKGIYEVRHSDSQIFYVTEDLNFMLQGNIIDNKNKTNLTQERLMKLNAIDFKTLPLKDSFTIVKGNGQRKIAVFEDPNCGYCKQFEKEIQKLQNVTVYVFLYPVLGSDSITKASNVWCSKNREKVWTDWMLNAVPIPDAKCADTPLERNTNFGKLNKINGTPSIIFEDGLRIPGFLTAVQIEEKLKNIKK